MTELTNEERQNLIISALSNLLKKQLGTKDLYYSIEEMSEKHFSPHKVNISFYSKHLDTDDFEMLEKFQFRREEETEDNNPVIDLKIDTEKFSENGLIPMKGKMLISLEVAYTDKDWEHIKKIDWSDDDG